MTADTTKRVDVHRYALGSELGMFPDDNGDYVLYTDYARLEEDRATARHAAAESAQEVNHLGVKLAELEGAKENYVHALMSYSQRVEAAERAMDESDKRANELRIAVGSYLNWYRRGDKKDALEKYGRLSSAHDAFLAANGEK